MTQPSAPGQALALPEDFATGLEDFDASDLRMPRLGIDHDKGCFVDSLSGAEFQQLEIVPLGMIKQRVLWKPEIEEKDAIPLCKSPDSKTGYPTLMMRDPKDNFPWGAVGLQVTDVKPNDEGRITLPCDACRLKEWKSHPDGKKTWCTEQHAVPLIYGEPGTTPYMTALFTTQRSSIRASQTFFASIVRRQLPAFAVRAYLTLNAQQRGKNTYYVPVFKECALTDQSEWPAYSEAYRSVRSFISQSPALKDADGNVIDPAAIGVENTINGYATPVAQPQPDPWGQSQPQQAWPPAQPYQPPVQQQPQYQQPAPQQPQYAQQPPQYQQPAPQHQYQAPPPEYQQPYQPPAQPQYAPAPPQYQAPVSAPPVQQAPPPPAPPVSAPPVQQAPPQPVAQPAPPQSAVQAVVQPTPVAATRADDDDDLPF